MGIHNYLRINKQILFNVIFCLENFNSTDEKIKEIVKQTLQQLRQYK